MQLEVEVRRHSHDSPWTYSLLDRRQREIAARIQQGQNGALLLSELAPVITLGRRAKPESLLFTEAELSRKGISLYPADRGGLETYHGPGQWVLFAVERLDRLTGDPRGVKPAVQALLEAAADVGRKYRSDVSIGEGPKLGVWSTIGKFAAVGVHVADGILLHGLSLNGFSTETSFVGLRPCGLEAPVDFLIKQSRPDETQRQFLELGDELCRAVIKRIWNRNESIDESSMRRYTEATLGHNVRA